MRSKTLLTLAILMCSVSLAHAQDKSAADPAKASRLARAKQNIEKAIGQYVAAFNTGDTAKLEKMWTPDCVYTFNGQRVIGRDAVLAQFKTALTDDKGKPNLVVHTESIEFISPSVALERGSAVVTRGYSAEETSYTAVYIKDGNSWLIDRVTEDEIVVQQSNYQNLADLEWLIGEWEDADTEMTISTNCSWTKNQNFISRTYKIASADGEIDSSGLQIIGWNAKKKQIQSWLFDSNGGFVSGVWTKRDDKWVVQSVAQLPDGSSGSFTSIFRPLDDGSYGWQKVNRVLEGKLMPNIAEVIIRRK